MAKTTKKESKKATSVKPFDLQSIMKQLMGGMPKAKEILDEDMPEKKTPKNKFNKKGKI